MVEKMIWKVLFDIAINEADVMSSIRELVTQVRGMGLERLGLEEKAFFVLSKQSFLPT